MPPPPTPTGPELPGPTRQSDVPAFGSGATHFESEKKTQNPPSSSSVARPPNPTFPNLLATAAPRRLGFRPEPSLPMAKVKRSTPATAPAPGKVFRHSSQGHPRRSHHITCRFHSYSSTRFVLLSLAKFQRLFEFLSRKELGKQSHNSIICRAKSRRVMTNHVRPSPTDRFKHY